MKQIRIKWNDKLKALNARWRILSLKKQQQCIRIVFTSYLLLTGFVFGKVWRDVQQRSNPVTGSIEHIKNPVLESKTSAAAMQDSLAQILKKTLYERK